MKGNHKKKEIEDLTPKGVQRQANSILTDHLKAIGNEVSDDIANDGTPLTKFEQLARLVWNRALGHKESIEGPDGKIIEVVHKPDKGFISTIFDRVEGRVAPTAALDDKKKASLADRIGEQSKSRLNRLAKSDD
jgi:hypothetical protein